MQSKPVKGKVNKDNCAKRSSDCDSDCDADLTKYQLTQLEPPEQTLH